MISLRILGVLMHVAQIVWSLRWLFAALVTLVLLVGGRPGTKPVLSSPGATVRVSVPNLADQGTLGTQANGPSTNASISDDGRYVAFESEATNLVLGDTNGVKDIFVHDRLTGATERVSVDSAGNQANGPSFAPAISGDGNVVAFSTWASNLVAGDTNGFEDVVIHNRATGATVLVSVSSTGGPANGTSYDPSLNSDGSFVAFSSSADNLVPGDSGGRYDIFLRDMVAGATTRIWAASNSARDPALSADSNFVVFQSYSSSTDSPGQAYLHDRRTGSTEVVSLSQYGQPGSAPSPFTEPEVSDDGWYVVFDSLAPLVEADVANLDVFLRDRQSSVTERVSTKPDGTSDGLNSWDPSISSDGRFVAFASAPEGTVSTQGLVPGDTNGNAAGVFVRDRLLMVTRRVSLSGAGPAISADGHFVAFGGVTDIFVVDLQGDYDGDGYIDTVDNCWSVSNPSQANGDGDPAGDACDNCPTVPNATQWDRDGDAFGNECDNCPYTSNPAQDNNIHPATYMGDHCEDPDFDGVKDYFDNCPDVSNRSQTNSDGDSLGNACDPDYDNDGVTDVVELPCGADPLDLTAPYSRPERVDIPGDDDGDTLIDEPLPAGAESYDCDGDGYTGSAEAHVFNATNVRDQDPCGTDAWPADFVSGGAPNSTDKVNVADLVSFIAPTRRINTNPADPGYDVRWDLVPGAGPFSKVINVTDISSIITVMPSMLGGVRAFNGPACPWP